MVVYGIDHEANMTNVEYAVNLKTNSTGESIVFKNTSSSFRKLTSYAKLGISVEENLDLFTSNGSMEFFFEDGDFTLEQNVDIQATGTFC